MKLSDLRAPPPGAQVGLVRAVRGRGWVLRVPGAGDVVARRGAQMALDKVRPAVGDQVFVEVRGTRGRMIAISAPRHTGAVEGMVFDGMGQNRYLVLIAPPPGAVVCRLSNELADAGVKLAPGDGVAVRQGAYGDEEAAGTIVEMVPEKNATQRRSPYVSAPIARSPGAH